MKLNSQKNKRITINKKLLSQIELIISNHLDISDEKRELLSCSDRLQFKYPPEKWNEEEASFCDYTSAVSSAIQEDILSLLQGINNAT